MAVVLLREPVPEVGNGLAGATHGGRLDDERQNDTGDAVNHEHDAAEDVQAACQAHHATQYRVVNLDTGQDQENHRNEIDPVRNAERERVHLFVVCDLCHDYRPPQGLICVLNS